MKVWPFLAAGLVILFACDPDRVYEQNYDLPHGQWQAVDSASFQFSIPDTSQYFDVYANVRNGNTYPYSRLFLRYDLRDSLNRSVQHAMIYGFLFDPKSGQPTGRSGLGDLYEHRFALLKAFRFPFPGTFSISLHHEMRPDTLKGVVSVGVRVARSAPVR